MAQALDLYVCLLYTSQPKEAYFAEGKSLYGRDRHPKECDCQRKTREEREAAETDSRHREEVER